MKGIAGGLLVLVLLGLGAWFFFYAESDMGPSPTLSEEGMAIVEVEVVEWVAEHLARYSDLDPQSLLAGWTSEDCSSISFADRSSNRAEVEAQVRRVLGGWESIALELLPGSIVDVISPDMAIFQGTVRQDFTPQGGEPGLYRVHMTFFLEKVEGEWKIKRNHVSGGAW